MAVIFGGPTFHTLASLTQSTNRCLQSRCHAWSLLSRSIMRHRFQSHKYLKYGTSVEHYAIKPWASSDENDVTETPLNSDPVVNKTSDKKAEAEAKIKKGQITAILTGAITIILGVGYLVLVQLLDTRGVVLQPPPPEAFDP
uniref:Uncharacterized protein n=1 Tax=Picea sitchensis TaxID=3332 RepID=A9NPL3_PICSI|nr:unknown [Picea sitchensis]